MQVANMVNLLSQAARRPLAASFVLSLLIHALLYGAYKAMPDRVRASQGTMARWLAALTDSPKARQMRLDDLKQLANQKLFEEMLELEREIPLTFVEVDPALASEPPKDPKYYSTHSTLAANPKPDKETGDPKIEGKETRMPRLFDNPTPRPRQTPQPLQPSVLPKRPEPPAPPPTPTPPREDKPPEVRPEAKPDAKSEPPKPLENLADRTHEKSEERPDLKPPGGEPIGDLAMAKPRGTEAPNKELGNGSPFSANQLITEPSEPPRHERPRTLAQVAQQNPSIAGKLMHQDGGVRERGKVSVDAKGSQFGAYDAALIAAVQERWYLLLEQSRYMLDRQGKVVLDFRLHYDGRITDMTLAENTVGDVLGFICQRAVKDPAPYARWPGDMRRMIGADYREVRFTFYYD